MKSQPLNFWLQDWNQSAPCTTYNQTHLQPITHSHSGRRWVFKQRQWKAQTNMVIRPPGSQHMTLFMHTFGNCTDSSNKNLRKCCKWPNETEQNKTYNFQQLFLIPAHSGKVIFRPGHTVPRLFDRQGGYYMISHI